LDNNGDGKYPRIRLRSGSTTNRKTFYIGPVEESLKALIFLRNVLCDTAIIDLQRILDTSEYPLWFYKDSPNNTKPPYEPAFIMKTTIALCKKIKPNSLPLPFDIDDLSGFFIEEMPANDISYKRLDSSIDLLDDMDFEQCLQESLIKILPEKSTSSFFLTQCYGRYWKGDFKADPYLFYLDVGWNNGKYTLRLLNIAGFPRENKRKPS
jgi:hypothetical protein